VCAEYFQNFRIVYSNDFTDEGTADDNFGHGTHVAGIAAGNSGRDNGAYRGVAPGANIVNLKVLDSTGIGNTSWLLNALEWIKLYHTKFNIRVVNLSLGGIAVDSYTNDPVNLKVQELNAEGILVVAAAGNNGKDANGQKVYGYIHSPGNDPSVLTVGAVNTYQTDSSSDDGITTFSSRGPTRSHYTNANGTLVYDNAIKPDLVAPGNKIGAPKAKADSYLARNYPTLIEPGMDITGDDDDVMVMSGTS
jgi:subtilisin family serine protease